MAAAVSISWSQILHQVSASLDDAADPRAARAPLGPLLSGLDRPPSWTGPGRDPDAAFGAARDRRHLDGRGAPDRAELEDLHRNVALLRDRLAAAESRTDETRTHADIRLRRVQAEADARIEEIRAEAQARVRLAERRAAAAERWLTRIDTAARALLAGDERSAGPAF